MRGNWEAGEALGLAPGHQLQQQQQSIMDEQRLPLHSPTTPAWGGITDRIVEEPTEDKNNDSGVSPGHYTSNSVSPRSRRSSSTVNCSLSPGSATSQDSNAMQCANFDYSQQSIYKNCESPIDYGRLRTMDDVSEHQTNENQPMDMVSISMKQESDDSEVPQDSLQCPVCPFVTLNRLQFTEHLAGHYAANCEMPDLSKSSLAGHNETHDEQQQQLQQMQQHMNAMEEANRASPSQGERSEQESEEADEPGLRVPRVNSQGKVKTFRCKQCNFVAITKLEFWEHSRGHIKAEKLLTCPKCPFVTEYKHHLEYHLRNHFGSKPFKCEKCSYSCVNKSMLNSHLKSHSNVYQYSCANCSYATKYCHSLKLHLRKYSHKPAMVLNADGSPNPLPIIDVYGTRRGPKQKPSGGNTGKPSDDNLAQIGNGALSIQPTQLVAQSEISPISRHSLNPMNSMNAMQMMGNGVAHGSMSLHYGQMFAGFPIANHYPMTDDATEKHLEHLKTNLLAEYAKVIANDRINAEYHHDMSMNDLVRSNINSDSPKISEIAESHLTEDDSNDTKMADVAATKLETSAGASTEVVNKVTPLDLSKPDVLANNNNHTNTNNNVQNDITAKLNDTNMNSPRASGKSRRKGRAVKLDRRIIEDESDDERETDTNDRDSTMMENTSDSTNILPMYEEETIQKASFGGASIDTCNEEETRASHSDGATVANSKEKSPDTNVGGVGMSNEFTCQYCEIAFGNVVMYTVHMGYHGYKDPYTCNMCGHECDDKVSFFLHIARSKHS